MRRLSRLLPHPLLSLAIALLWLGLAPQPSLGALCLGLLLGVAIPRLTARFWPDRPRIASLRSAGRLIAVVLADILIANWQVARLVVGPVARLRPRIVRVPLDIDDPFVVTILGSIVSLTPGTVSLEIDRHTASLIVHALDVDDEAQLIGNIKVRYEAPLKEIFQC
jgi:multicomponent K+:H+ antiporter subunit E